MKKNTLHLLLLCLSLAYFPLQSNAAVRDTPPTEAAANANMPEEVKVLLHRLDEINAMDKSALTSSEKRKLRKEVKSIQHSLSISNNGVYLSGGTLILIIILLIIFL